MGPPIGKLKSSKTEKALETIEWIFRALVSSFCGTLIFLNVNREKAAQMYENNYMKNTFFPFLIHVILCLLEQIIVIFIPTFDEKPLSFIITPFVLMLVSVGLTGFYYHQFHPGSVLQTNGPKFQPEDKKSALCICKTLFCCQMQDWEIPDISYKRMTPSTSM